jgi:hypothetical protein
MTMMMFKNALREEYLENGDKLEMNGDLSILSSRGFVDEYIENGSKMDDEDAASIDLI